MSTIHPSDLTMHPERSHGIYWPAVVAGAFVALALFVVSVVLARACYVDTTLVEARTAGEETGAILWGAIAALVSFGIGGAVAGRCAAAAGRERSWLNGLLVWAVAVPILAYWLGAGVGPRLGQTAYFGGGTGPVAMVHAGNGGVIPAHAIGRDVPNTPYPVRHPQMAAWFMVLSLGLSLIGATVMGEFAAGRRATA